MSKLVLGDINLRFGGLTVLDSVSFNVSSGELLALIGPNGAGKTSVFNCINGIYRPQGGTIKFGEQELIGMMPSDIVQLGIARTFQHGELFPDMTVVGNLMTARHARIATTVFGEMLRLPGARREERRHREAIERTISVLDLEEFCDQRVDQFPFGLQKRIGIARALASEPSLLLLDEPSAGLTHTERLDLAYYILKARDELGISMIWIEHDIQMVADIADRIHVLDYGRSLSDGAPADVLNNPDVIRAYLGDVELSDFTPDQPPATEKPRLNTGD